MNIPKSLLSAALLLPVFGIGPASAFDCAKAQSPVEKAICADQKLKAADDAMTAAYLALRNALTGPDRKALGAAQSKWVKARENRCGYQQAAELTDCILSDTDERRRLLLAEPESGPGAGSRMTPVFIQQDGDPHHYDVDYTLIKFVKPKSRGENLFNSEVSKLAKGAPLERQAEAARDDMTYSAVASMALTYASPSFLSAKVESWSFSGGAHGNGGTSGMTIDLARGAVLKTGDLFDSKAVAALKGECVKQILAQKKEKLQGEDFDPANDPLYSEKTVVEYLQSLANWNFWQDKATVTFDAYAIGSYAEGPYSCDFAMDDLRKLAKPGAPLPR
ncbi:MAG: lysozyme inhibitor LprI family protein [Parvibaculaceae bacterium]